jgi:hypothetical protein
MEIQHHHIGRLGLGLKDGQDLACTLGNAASLSKDDDCARIVVFLRRSRLRRAVVIVEACRDCWSVLRGALAENPRPFAVETQHHIGRLVLSLKEGEHIVCKPAHGASRSPHDPCARVEIALKRAKPGRCTLNVEACEACVRVLRGTLSEESPAKISNGDPGRSQG